MSRRLTGGSSDTHRHRHSQRRPQFASTAIPNSRCAIRRHRDPLVLLFCARKSVRDHRHPMHSDCNRRHCTAVAVPIESSRPAGAVVKRASLHRPRPNRLQRRADQSRPFPADSMQHGEAPIFWPYNSCCDRNGLASPPAATASARLPPLPPRPLCLRSVHPCRCVSIPASTACLQARRPSPTQRSRR